MSQTIDQLKQSRGLVKAALTRIETFCQRPNAPPSEVRVRLDKLDEYFRQFETIQAAIEDGQQSVEQATENERYRTQVEEIYYSLKALGVESHPPHDRMEPQASSQLTAILENIVQNQGNLNTLIQTMSAPLASSTPVLPTSQNVSTRKGIKLPQIHVPEFDGQYINWIRFKDLFETMIHNRSELSNIEKFEYLQGLLKGDALCVIKHMKASNDNYTPAWELVKKKYENSIHIKRAYFELLFDQHPMKAASPVELNRVMNKIHEGVNSLKALNEPTESWDSILVFFLERKLDAETHMLWCRESSTSFELFMNFLGQRLQELERCKPTKINAQPAYQGQRVKSIHASAVKSCPACNSHHPLFSCERFKGMTVNQRIELVRHNKLCFNCLEGNHMASNCNRSKCRKCKASHNTMLHREVEANYAKDTMNAEIPSVAVNAISNVADKTITLLPTAIIPIKDSANEFQLCRVLLDTGAQITLISERCAQRLGLQRKFDKTLLHGVGQTNTTVARGRVTVVMQTTVKTKTLVTEALCLNKLTQDQPGIKVDSNKFEYFNSLALADSSYNLPSQVDLILGADILCECILNQSIQHPSGSPSALLTVFGWVIMGRVPINQPIRITVAHMSEDLSAQLRAFWELDELQAEKQFFTEDEEAAETHYVNNHSRTHNGQYMVRLPFKTEKPTFYDTKKMAISRLRNMETRFHHNHTLHEEYVKFMNEFIELNHMELNPKSVEPRFYMPHHAVLKPTSTTTKLRVVFDGSAMDKNGMSLNNQLLIGPTIQNDLITILIQFRKYKIAMCSDIEKMYRQILIHPDDRAYQCIVWTKGGRIVTYCLNTVTYGTSAAPFLAIRTLKQIALDCYAQHPDVSNILTNAFYVDDLMCSVPSIKQAVQLKDELDEVLSQAHLHLRKWSSNSNTLLEGIRPADRAVSIDTVIEDNKTVKTLGVLWDTSTDEFKYNVQMTKMVGPLTKRKILSTIARVFDPLGWLAPVIIRMKLFMQTLWIRNVDWDTELPQDILQQWEQVYYDMSSLGEIRISRWLHYSDEKFVELHAYADASEVAFAAVVYLRVIHDNGMISTQILGSKTRVAPVKQVTLPRLELCAAQLAARLMVKMKAALGMPQVTMHGWSDSKIVLAWLSDHPRRWKNFVANRTSYIINVLPAQFWHHVPSKENPADLATRGILPSELVNLKLWWQGPESLRRTLNIEHQPRVDIPADCDVEQRSQVICQINAESTRDLLQLYSTYSTLMRTTAWIIRFSRNCRSKVFKVTTGRITTDELEHAHKVIVKVSQQNSFKPELRCLTNGNQLPSNHKLSQLSPFIDHEGLLRVGGRLQNAIVPFEQRHPLILDKDNKLTSVIIEYYHLKYLHAGSRQLQYLIGLRYWVPGIIYVIKRCVYKCVICMRFRSKPYTQQMGNLPTHRVAAASAFVNVGVDFAGPMLIKSWSGRGGKQHKCWIALFVCLATKAIHLELVTSLSADAFIATLRRFVARRGKPLNIYSDNGTNFVGCNTKLKEFTQFLVSTKTQDLISKETTSQGISWHFSPPSGPHFGGLWEAGVKSMKYHLNRVLKNNSATFEELTTVLCQIEACLNSRPLCAKFHGDLDPLTPGHFLIHRNTELLPDQDHTHTKINRLTRWQYLQRLTQEFWTRWSNDYLKQLQPRPKWAEKLNNLNIDDMVIVKDEQLPPAQWSIGRVIETHPGADGLLRVVTVRTSKGSFKRPIHKLCPLFVDL